MKKSILNLKGAQELTKNEQKSINGGDDPLYLCKVRSDCPNSMKCKIVGVDENGVQYGYCY